MSSQIDSFKEIIPAPSSSSDPKPAQSEMGTRVEAIWEQMNKGLSNKSTKLVSKNRSSSTMNNTAYHKQNDNWMAYLGLARKGIISPAQDAQQMDHSGVQGGTSNEEKKVAALWEQMNKGVFSKSPKFVLKKSSSTVDKASEKSDNWMTFLGMATKKTESGGHDAQQKESANEQNGSGDAARKLAAAALSAVKDATAAALSKGKVEITEVRDFAGQEIEVKKLVDAESKEAAERAKAPVSSGVDAVLEQIRKKQKLSVLDKTKKDWGEFKEENKGLEDELDAYKKSSNQYLDKVSFLQRTDYREFEREREARLALQARRRPDMREDSS